MKTRSLLLAVAVALASTCTRAGAVPLPGPGPGVPPTMGESDLFSFTTPGNNVNVDWIVQPSVISGAGYDYLFQIENSSGSPSGIDTFTITIPWLTATMITGGGVLAGDDLDAATGFHAAHGLAGEEDPFGLAPLVATLFTTNLVDGTVTWTFSPLAAGAESDTLYFLSPLPPTYVVGTALDSTPPSPWSSAAPSGDPVPAPVPEPGTLLLLGSGLLGLGFLRRRA